MDIAALLFACSVHADDPLLLSIASVHARGSPYVVVDVSSQALEQDDAGPVMIARSATAARSAVERIVAAGGEPVLGLLPVRPEWATEFGKTLADLFDDPCSDVAVASAKLSEFDYACRSRGPQRAAERRACTLDLYGRSLGLPALRQAALADLTLPSPFPSTEAGDSQAGDSQANEEIWASSTSQSNSGLFFAARALAPAASLPIESPALPPEEGR